MPWGTSKKYRLKFYWREGRASTKAGIQPLNFSPEMNQAVFSDKDVTALEEKPFGEKQPHSYDQLRLNPTPDAAAALNSCLPMSRRGRKVMGGLFVYLIQSIITSPGTSIVVHLTRSLTHVSQLLT